jgi:LmbE family N-acetylglucosaminyl deacetylase
MGLKNRIFRSFATGGTLWPEAAAFSTAPELMLKDATPGIKALLVVAHPDDESECAAVLYRITHELGGTVDQVIVTNGEAGFQHAAPAQAYYQLPLTREDVGRKHLPRIRRQEVLRASQILGIRDTYFLEQKDNGFTVDVCEGLQVWDVQRVRTGLVHLMEREEYDLVFTLLPTEDTHGHHQTVAILVLQAVAEFAPEQQPAVLGVRSATAEERLPDRFDGIPGFPLTRTAAHEPVWRFDRRTSMLGHPALDYTIVVNWVIAEHKSQGMFQMEFGRRPFEYFWLFAISEPGGRSRWNRFLGLLHGASQQEEHPAPKREHRGHAYAHVGI